MPPQFRVTNFYQLNEFVKSTLSGRAGRHMFFFSVLPLSSIPRSQHSPAENGVPLDEGEGRGGGRRGGRRGALESSGYIDERARPCYVAGSTKNQKSLCYRDLMEQIWR